MIFPSLPIDPSNNSGKKCWIECENRCIRAILESVEEYIKRMNICLYPPLVRSISHSATSTRLSSTLFPRVECHQQIFQARLRTRMSHFELTDSWSYILLTIVKCWNIIIWWCRSFICHEPFRESHLFQILS